MAKQFNLQKYSAKDFSGLITQNHLYDMFMKQPQAVNNYIKQIWTTNLGYSYRDFVESFPVKEVEQENGFYEWPLKGQDEKNIPLQGATHIDGTTVTSNVGAQGQQWYMIYNEGIFDPGDVLLGEVEDYHLLVKDKSKSGTQYKYKVELVTHDPTLAVPVTEIFVGSRWSKDYHLTQSTLSYRGTKPMFSSSFLMENRLSFMRMDYEVPGNMIEQGKNEPLKFYFPYGGKYVPVWTNYYDMVAMDQFESQFYRMHLYGKRNWTAQNQYLNRDENSDFTIESGEGFFNQIAPGNKFKYNSFNLDNYVSVIMDKGVGRLDRGKRRVKILTGEFGAAAIHKEIEKKAKQWTTIAANAPLVRSTSSGNLGTPNTLGFGAQWNQYVSYNGVVLDVEILPFLDDDVRFKTYHPDGGLVESYRMLALDYGGEAGIYRVKPKGRNKIWAMIPGLRDPFSLGGKGTPKVINSEVDGYKMICADWGGMMIEDPSKILDHQYNFVR